MNATARLLDVIEHDIAPLTRAGVEVGNKLFGAAILRRGHDPDGLALVTAATNNEIENPLWHGEIHAIKQFYEIPAAERPAPADCLFLATHEPCSLCLSGIVWSGFDNVSYLFSHADSAESFAIPHDIAILRAVYAVPDPDRAEPAPGRDLYNRTNAYLTSTDLGAAVAALPELAEQLARLSATYDELSAIYQSHRGGGAIAHA